MKTSLNCPQGHTWQIEPSANGATQACPTCGAAALAPEAETVAPRANPFHTLPPADPRDAATVAPSDAATTGERRGSSPPSVPGYELLSELGRGGMGVVYQARHRKLNRLVALKMILAGSHAGAADLARFQTEAEAIARLQHPNIVQVYEVGEHEGKPFFSLEFCAGGSLAQKLNGTPLPAREAAALLETLARAMQAAHDQHIIHRDLKPANVLLTEAGVPKITDFGLAKKLDEAGQTHSGAIMGTPSYMAPEQAGGQSGAIGPAADVYALGALLYECLTGRPPFKAATALDTIMQVVSDDPVPPRHLQSKTPRDLETICLKCLRKEPAKRYGSAAVLAEDLRRWQAGEPILARPVGRVERTVKWVRRKPVAAALLVALALAFTGGGWGLWQWSAQRSDQGKRAAETERAVSVALAKAEQGVVRAGGQQRTTFVEARAALGDWREAEGALAEGEAALAAGAAADGLRKQVADMRQRIESGREQEQRRANLFDGLDKARMASAANVDGTFDFAGAARKYLATFTAHGLVVKASDTEELARRIRAEDQAVRAALLIGLDDWAWVASKTQTTPAAAELGALAAAADDDPWRAQLRQAWAARDRVKLRDLSVDARKLSLPASSLTLLARRLATGGERLVALALLRWARQEHPADFWIHFELGFYLNVDPERTKPLDLEECIGCFRAALALRPDGSVTHNNIGVALYLKNQLDDATAACKKAIELDPDNADPHCNLGVILYAKKKVDDAIAEYKKAIDINPKHAWAHTNLGRALQEKHQLKDAIAEYQKAVDLDPGHGRLHYNLGVGLAANNQLDDALAEYRTAIKLEPTYAPAYFNAADVLHRKHQMNDAIVEYRKAIKLEPNNAKYHQNLGTALYDNKQLDDAIEEYKKTIDLGLNDALVHISLGNTLQAKNRLEAAMAEFQKAVELDPNNAQAHLNFGNLLGVVKKQWDAAITEYGKAIELEPKYALAHASLAQALLMKGRFAEAKMSYRQALELLPEGHPHRRSILQQSQQCNGFLALEAQLPDVLAGKVQLADNRRRGELIAVCQLQQRHAAAAKLYADAFAADPKSADDLQKQYRYNAACFAALAAAGQGKDAGNLDEKERDRLRKQALDWLRADLALWTKQAMSEKLSNRELVHKTLKHWQEDTDLAGLRDKESLKKLADDQREVCQKLWTDVAALLKQASDAM